MKSFDELEGWVAFARADRAYRTARVLDPQIVWTRSVARENCALSSSSTTDLELAIRLGSSDPNLLELVLKQHSDANRRAYFAHLIIESDRASDAQVEFAVQTLFAHHIAIVLHGQLVGRHLSGWVAGPSVDVPTLLIRRSDGSKARLHLQEIEAQNNKVHGRRWHFVTQVGVEGAFALDAISSGGCVVSKTFHTPVMTPRWQRPSQAIAGRSAESTVNVIIPVYGDAHSLAMCLDALRRQDQQGLCFILIDDASPDPSVSSMAQEFCSKPNAIYRRNLINGGFAAAVNMGLSLCSTGDVLILNSDVILPDGAVKRLKNGTYSSPDIGIAAPFSNDAGNTTFPDPMAPGPAVPFSRAIIIDDVASRVNAGLVIDLISVLGSCLFVTRSCLDRVGQLSLAYGRGYYEDVDLCLRARECGFRVVGVCDIYVTHLSGRSFGESRYPLIVRNAAILDARFPKHGSLDAAHDRANPLSPARAAIEEVVLPVTDHWVVLIGRKITAGAAMQWRANALRKETISLLHVNWHINDGKLHFFLSTLADGGPRSLVFVLDSSGNDFVRLDRYLARLSITRIEVFEPETMPASIRAWLTASRWSLTYLIDGWKAAAAAGSPATSGDGGSLGTRAMFVPTDELSAACLLAAESWLDGRSIAISNARAKRRSGDLDAHGRDIHDVPSSRHRGDRGESLADVKAITRLGVLMPMLCARAEAFVLTLSRVLASRGGPHIFVFGRCIAERQMVATGKTCVTGPIDMAKLPISVVEHGIQALLLPYYDYAYWLIDAASINRHLPCAYFDWSPAGLPVRAGDLVLNRELADHVNATDILAWSKMPYRPTVR